MRVPSRSPLREVKVMTTMTMMRMTRSMQKMKMTRVSLEKKKSWKVTMKKRMWEQEEAVTTWTTKMTWMLTTQALECWARDSTSIENWQVDVSLRM
jgi:hypothetical protein